MTAASTGGRPRRPVRPARPRRPARPPRLTFWVDRGGTLGPTLLRYDPRSTGVHRGARLGVDGRWHASTQPEELWWAGRGAGEEIGLDEARRIARALGLGDADLTDPRVLP
ncbi:hypothetical protein ACR9E3_27765 [Actinomycetospora sp. C-140]